MTQLASNALTTLADVKESLGISSGDVSKDNLIIRKINQASLQIANYCDRVFAVADYTEEINGTYTDEIVLKQRPVNSITSLEFRGSAVNTDNWIATNSSYYFYDANSGILRLLFNAKGRWNRWRVTYNAGYTTTPADLSEACATLAAFYVNNPDGSDVGVQEIREGMRMKRFANTSQTFISIMQQLGIDQIINGYANWPLINE